ncbi:MAG: DUF108 domain-containing protein [Burkholderiales bacterium]|nr:MAG: DUF108 domain-containing protein [Burkholderiales bacterium]
MPEQLHAAGAGKEAAPITIGIAGLGNLGSEIARWLVASAPPRLRLVAAADLDRDDVARRLGSLGASASAVALRELPGQCDLVVECLAPEAAAELLDCCVDRGGIVVPLSVCVLLGRPDLIERARASGTRLLVPSGAVAGVEALRAAAMGRIHSVKVRTSKPPAGVDAQAAPGRQKLFGGNALEACEAFPRNVNISATLSLAGIGGERTEVEIWADPDLERNVHEIEIDSDSTLVRIRIENRPSRANPRSSAITANSVCALLQALVDPVRIGS